MVPRTSRGHSFAGASMYYFHDKQAQTNERVEWYETHNVPTDDPDKAIKWMQYTAMNANKLKQEMGVKMSGRKSTKGEVYTYSLSWHGQETPDREHMKSCLTQTLEVLGLQDHEAIFIAHNDTDHPHVHAIVNLVSPIDGKMNTVYNDRKKLSKWAEAYEKEHGVYCKKRIENNKNRTLDQDNKNKLTRKEEQLKRAQLVHDLYTRSDGAKAFQAAMKEQGFDLTIGKRRAFSFVDEQGKIHSLSRHMNLVIDKEQNPKWRSDMKARLDGADLVDANMIAAQRKKEWAKQQHFDRDEYHAAQQDKIDQAGIDADQKRKDHFKQEAQKSKTVTPEKDEHKQDLAAKRKTIDTSTIDHTKPPERFGDSYKFLEDLDEKRKSENLQKLKDKWEKAKQAENLKHQRQFESIPDEVSKRDEANDNVKDRERLRMQRNAERVLKHKARKKDRDNDRDLER